MLVPEPGKPPQALATVTVVDPSPAVSKVWNEVVAHSKTVVLEGYTRDGWAWKPGGGANALMPMVVQSVDGKKKLPGFVKYLKDRQKCAYGRFLLDGTTGMWVVSYVQKPTGNEDRMECRIGVDLTKIPGCTLSAAPPGGAAAKAKVASPPVPPPAAASTSKRAGSGLLGKLVGAQKKTNQHVLESVAITQQQQQQQAPKTTTTAQSSSGGGASLVAGEPVVETKTAQQVLSDFRADMEQKMLDFDISAESELKVPISLAQYTAGMTDADKAKVTMEILKYMVYEAAEEVNEEWIAHKEPSEFMDEIVVAVYKEGAAPLEVLEDINKGEMTEEMRAQQLALQGERMRQMSAVERKRAVEMESSAHLQYAAEEDTEEVAALNTKKRDRRTIEDYEREKKRGKS